jgi:molecular chaperone HtpG
LTVSDNGIGLSRQEVIDTIGSIASSGTRRFVEALSGDQAKDSKLIGQFGVGFYSAFIVADKVTLISRRAGLGSEHGVRWESDGRGSFTLETVEKPGRGTDVVLHLKDDEKEFLDTWRLRSIIGKFSDHLALPVEMRKELYGEEAEKAKDAPPEYEQVNRGTALWMRNKSEITEEEYHDFYKHVSHDFDAPLAYAHNRVEGTNEYTTLLFVPKRAPWDLWERDPKHGVKLYVRRVFIMDEADKLMPHYLRFVKGVVDSDDLPLNVSREILQHNRKIDTIRQANTKRVLGLLETLAKDEPEKYGEFWDEFGRVLKEGPAEDFANKERIAGLLRFASTHERERCPARVARRLPGADEGGPGQDLLHHRRQRGRGASQPASGGLPQEGHRGAAAVRPRRRVAGEPSRRVQGQDAAVGRQGRSRSRRAGRSGGEGGEGEGRRRARQPARAPQVQPGRAGRVGPPSTRLVDSPACLVVGEHDMSAIWRACSRRSVRARPRASRFSRSISGIRLVKRLEAETRDDRFADLALILLDQAQLAEGGQLDDPAAFVGRLNKLMLSMLIAER